MGGTRASGRVSKIVVRVSRKPQPGTRMPKFSKPLILLALAVVATSAVLGVGAQPAQARSMSKCSAALIHDWYVDGRVDTTRLLPTEAPGLRPTLRQEAVPGAATLRYRLSRRRTDRERVSQKRADRCDRTCAISLDNPLFPTLVDMYRIPRPTIRDPRVEWTSFWNVAETTGHEDLVLDVRPDRAGGVPLDERHQPPR